MRAIHITRFGGPEVLELVEDHPEPEATRGSSLLEVSAAGVNYADTHRSEDSYLAPQSLPFVPGAEAVGTLPDGRRVVALVAGGGYAQRAVVADGLAFEIPESVDDGQALALVLQGTTAWHLLATSAQLREGESVVVHAAAGGVGSLAIQLAKRFGAGRVIASASSERKRQLALDLGADVAIDANTEDPKTAIEDANGGKVDVVLEMAGGPTMDASLATLAPFGRLITYGMASRQAPTPVDPARLLRRSQGILGFWLAHCMSDPKRYLADPMDRMLDLVATGDLRPVVGGTYALSDAAQAHRDILDRGTVGKLVLDPSR